jgi:sulfatase modifying factor 1
MKFHTQFSGTAALFAALILIARANLQADTFGSGTNAFTLDFVTISNAGNATDTNGFGAVLYEYRIGKYEISQNNIDKATASGMANVTAGSSTGNQPAGLTSWYDAAAFVNWLNTSKGHTAAYNLTFSNGSWIMAPWSSSEAWQAGGQNLYRHKNARYFLPSENEWYKAAYYNQARANYFLYPTGSDTAPTPVAIGTDAGTAVYLQRFEQGVGADVTIAGGLSPYGTMAQGGNIFEWVESASDGTNDDATEARILRGGSWYHQDWVLTRNRPSQNPNAEYIDSGFRVASALNLPTTNVILSVKKTSSLNNPWQLDREINVGPMTNTNEFYKLEIRTVVE